MRGIKGNIFFALVLCMIASSLFGQSKNNKLKFGAGLSFSNDFYNRYSNPEDSIAHSANGSAVLNLALGPKIWIGVDRFSISIESQANYGILGLALRDYKGLGSFSVPIMAKLNFAGLSGLNRDMDLGVSIGGGIQYNKTEIYGLTQEYENLGVAREYYKTYNVQLGYGLGISGFTGHIFARYGFNPDIDGASNLHLGLQLDFNLIQLKKIRRPESEL